MLLLDVVDPDFDASCKSKSFALRVLSSWVSSSFSFCVSRLFTVAQIISATKSAKPSIAPYLRTDIHFKIDVNKPKSLLFESIYNVKKTRNKWKNANAA